MRPIHTARVDKVRPVLILTREVVRPHRTRVTVAPITSAVRGLATEVPVGLRNGIDRESVVSCDNIATIDSGVLGPCIGYLMPDQELSLSEAIRVAFDLE